MAGKRTQANTRRTSRAPSTASPRRSKKKGSVSQWARRISLWCLKAARPRATNEVLTLALVLVAVVTLVTQSAIDLYHVRRPEPNLFWGGLLLLLAVAARVAPRWRRELEGMTADRARGYAGSMLILFIALSLSWHLISMTMGLDGAYLFLGPASQAPAAIAVFVLLGLLALALVVDLPIGALLDACRSRGAAAIARMRERELVHAAQVSALAAEPDYERLDDEVASPAETSGVDRDRSVMVTQPLEPVAAPPQPAEPSGDRETSRPPIDIFAPAPKNVGTPPDLDLKAQRIEETLASFNVGAKVVGHHCGPVVTQFDVQPDRGVKVRRITELQNDLALALAAPTIRIQAPVPGKPVVGIEIPNASATMVALRDLLESSDYRAMSSPLKVVLGKDVLGNSAVIDLAKMPHLLIAGATGSGKSVCVNALISCLLYQSTPDDVRLMMIDPKMVELTVYNGVPHLLAPVVTEMDKVVGVLQWALREMERRYQLFKTTGVRNIGRFNEKADANGLKRLPYIVLVVDELADLMMVAPEDVEEAICRLAQLARAAGIHMVIATQRPSVDVVTGLIKANFPARIAFAMTSQVDSRTILDTVGAEKLLGRGDMLYMPPDAPKPVRLQGAHLSDQEIEDLVDFWKKSPLQTTAPRVAEEEFAQAERASRDVDDELLQEATNAVREYQHASVSLLQRRLKVGYARAARLMDQLEARGVVGPVDGSKQRPVLAREPTLTETNQSP
ncbi:MAG: hypothetical protein NVS4B2_24110 [Chloroflexota bacterium]